MADEQKEEEEELQERIHDTFPNMDTELDAQLRQHNLQIPTQAQRVKVGGTAFCGPFSIRSLIS